MTEIVSRDASGGFWVKLNEQTKNFLSLFLRVGLSGLLLAYLFRKMDLSSMLELLKNADFGYLWGAGIIYLIINAIILLRWVVVMRGLGLKVPLIEVIRYFFIGLFFNLFLPSSTGGDIIKTLGICRFTEHKARVVASVVLDRLCGFVGIVIVAFFAFTFGYRFINDFALLIAIVVLAFVSASILTVLFNERIYSFCCRIFDKVPKIKNSLMNLHYDIVLLKDNPVVLLQAVGLSCVTQVVLAYTFFLFSKILQQDIHMVYFLIFVPIICVVSSLPSIGGLGVRDAGAVHLFAKVGVASQVAVSISLMSFIFMVAVGLIGGIVYVAQLSPRRVQHHQSAPSVSPKRA